MNPIVVFGGIILLSVTATANNLNPRQIFQSEDQAAPRASEKMISAAPCVTCKSAVAIDLDEIVYIEEEMPVVLGFNTSDYLPEGFDPHEAYVDLDAIPFLEEEEVVEIPDLEEWLPQAFDPYAAPTDIRSISYMEDTDADPVLDTQAWLPEGFNPYEAYNATAKSTVAEVLSK